MKLDYGFSPFGQPGDNDEAEVFVLLLQDETRYYVKHRQSLTREDFLSALEQDLLHPRAALLLLEDKTQFNVPPEGRAGYGLRTATGVYYVVPHESERYNGFCKQRVPQDGDSSHYNLLYDGEIVCSIVPTRIWRVEVRGTDNWSLEDLSDAGLIAASAHAATANAARIFDVQSPTGIALGERFRAVAARVDQRDREMIAAIEAERSRRELATETGPADDEAKHDDEKVLARARSRAPEPARWCPKSGFEPVATTVAQLGSIAGKTVGLCEEHPLEGKRWFALDEGGGLFRHENEEWLGWYRHGMFI